MIKVLCLWITGIFLLPQIVLCEGIGSLEREAYVSGRLEDQTKELKRDLSFYRYEGSLWEERSSSFYMDNTARRINDILTIKIDEISNASQQVSTKTSRDSSILASIAKFLGSPLDFGLENLWVLFSTILFQLDNLPDHQKGGLVQPQLHKKNTLLD